MNISEEATRHARSLQRMTALSGFAAAIVFALLETLVFPESWNNGITFSLFAVPMGGLLSIHISWVAIWAVLGPGSLSRRLFHGLAIVQLAFALLLLIEMPFINDDHGARFDFLLAFVAFWYATVLQALLSMSLVWLLKYLRFRLVYATDNHLLGSLQASSNQVDANDRSKLASVHVVSPGPPRLIDLLGLIAVFAIGFGLWVPSLDGFGMPHQGFLGPEFAFILVLGLVCTNGAIGLIVVLLPMLVALSVNLKTGIRFALLIIAVLLAVAGTTAGLKLATNFDDALFWYCGFVTFGLYLSMLARMGVLRANQIHFRLIRVSS